SIPSASSLSSSPKPLSTSSTPSFLFPPSTATTTTTAIATTTIPTTRSASTTAIIHLPSTWLRLSLTHQNLSTLPDLFLHPPLRLSPLIHLTHLNLSHNQLSSIPPQIGYLHSLRSLDLSNNQITELPCQLATKLSAIETIDVCNNPLATSQIDLVYVSSGVPSLSDLVFRYLVNKDYRFINSKNGELPNVVGSLPSVLKERLINEWHPICAVCDSVHLAPVATMRLLKWICLIPNVPLRYELCSARCAR